MIEERPARAALGSDGPSLQDHLRRALQQLPQLEVVEPGWLAWVRASGDGVPFWVSETREVLGPYPDPDADYDDDPFRLWQLLDVVRASDRRHVVYGVLVDEVVVGDAALVYAISVVADQVDDWERCVPWLRQEQETLVPEELIDRYGELGTSMVSGSCVTFDAAHTDRLVRALRRRGFSCRRDDTAIARACGCTEAVAGPRSR